VTAEMWSDFWKNFGQYCIPYHIAYDPLMHVYTLTCTCELFGEVIEGGEMPYYTPSFKRLSEHITVLSGV